MASVIYQNIFLYRTAMMILYSGSYYQRAKRICSFIESGNVTELCFGDTLIAKWCRKNQMKWTGIDINKKFVHCAVKKGYNAIQANLIEMNQIPSAKICIMSGSLYHFHEVAVEIIEKMLRSAPRVMICEPVRNLSAQRGITGRIARFFSRTVAGSAGFRYNKDDLLSLLQRTSESGNFTFMVADEFKKDITVILNR